ncbi:hypothetical protein LEP1GSC163_1256 [Leptospira santarosai str. CBC379]|nr:hypothetical protein LEP1GSC163_1256 [Leptospira santarosai str. CBC379]
MGIKVSTQITQITQIIISGSISSFLGGEHPYFINLER